MKGYAGMVQKNICRFSEELEGAWYSEMQELSVRFAYNAETPITRKNYEALPYKTIKIGEKWGNLWGSAWFKFTGQTPKAWQGREVVALVDIGGEGLVYKDGTPFQGITHKGAGYFTRKRRIPLFKEAAGGETIAFDIEAGANELFGYHGKTDGFHLHQAVLACYNEPLFQFAVGFKFLAELAASLESQTPRAKRLYAGLEKIIALYYNNNFLQAQKLLQELYRPKAHASSIKFWSVGHAHIDLAWLWPLRETRRKTARTFATALQLLSEYPDYIFGASQPQQFAWLKEDHPDLYQRVKEAVKQGRLELQGAMWCEPDTNLPSGESLARQCVYGRRFFREEFGVEVDNLWLPDVFGYSAALPQILKKCGVHYFLTQKMSWNDTNRLPFHTFNWQGLDGSSVLTHFPPNDTYNSSSTPELMIAAERRFAQSAIQSDAMNLFGEGDGGGGPGRKHLEYVKRGADTEGMPRLAFGRAKAFFKKITGSKNLPVWSGELYFETHRGTYTSQARVKKNNKELETALKFAEFLAFAADKEYRKELEAVWKEALLLQFHDILPGSSIAWVYEEAQRIYEAAFAKLAQIKQSCFEKLYGKAGQKHYAVCNALSWARTEIIAIPQAGRAFQGACDSGGRVLPSCLYEGSLYVEAALPAFGTAAITLTDRPYTESGAVKIAGLMLENRFLKIKMNADGSIASLFNKRLKRESLQGPANRLLLWPDKPVDYHAWDIDYTYRDMLPKQAKLTHMEPFSTCLFAGFKLVFALGERSVLEQKIVLEKDAKVLKVFNKADWQEREIMLRMHTVSGVKANEASYETQFGIVKRPTHNNTSWQQAQFEVCGHRFADMSEPDFGLALLSCGKYGYRIKQHEMELNLLRSPDDPDPLADQGRHEFAFAFYPHEGDFERSNVWQTAHAFNEAPELYGCAEPPQETSLFAIEGAGVKLETVKRADLSEGVLLRFYETVGRSATVSFRSAKVWKALAECDLEENIIKQESQTAALAKLKFKPFEIKSYIMHF